MNQLIDFKSRFKILKGGKVSLVVSALIGSVIIANAAPTGGVVTSGTANISQNGSTTNITQSSQKATINWQDFSIKSNETVNFNQANSSSITLNRVIGNEKTIIDGALNANGQVWILNSNGILFNSSAKVNTAGLLATTAQLSDKDFQNGNYNFKNSSKNSVLNLGTIEVTNNSYVVLASNEVKNSGTIKAVKGKVYLTGASEYTVNLNGNSIVNLIVDKGVLDSLVDNSGSIIADGGEIYLTTNAVNELLKGVVNNTGILEANSLDGLTGKVEVFAHGGSANVSGIIEAKEGFVETSGENVKIAENTKVKAKEWLIDPTNFTISAGTGSQTNSSIGATTLSNNLETTSVIIQTDNSAGNDSGDIFVNSAVSWSSDKTLTLNAYRNIYINNDITATNANGKLALYYGQGTVSSGNTATYDFGLGSSGFKASINLQSGQNLSTKLGSDGTVINYTVITDATALQAIDTNNTTASRNYALGSNINLSGISWRSLGQNGYAYRGHFDGLGHIINNLTINTPGNPYVGLFGQADGAFLSNIGVTNVDIVGYSNVGALIGNSAFTSINNCYSTGNVSGATVVGGLIGIYQGGSAKKVYSTVNVSSLESSYDGGSMGGLIGKTTLNFALYDSYATGDVTDSNTPDWMMMMEEAGDGGLIGTAYNSTINNSYSVGKVNGVNSTGGLIGLTNNVSISGSFYDKTVNPDMFDELTYGKTTTQMQTLSTYTNAGWNISGNNGTYPTFSTTGTSVWTINGTPPSVVYLNYNLSDITSGHTYNGSEITLSSLWNASTIFGSTYSSWVLGTDYNFVYNTNTVTGFTNAGTYSGLTVDILKSGYSEATSGNTAGSLVISKKAIDLSVSKTYDGNANFTSGFTLDSNDIVNGDSVNINGNATTSSANAGNYNSFSSNTLALDNNNYTLTGGAIDATINKANATVTANSDSKTYNGLSQSVSGFIASGLVNNETTSVLLGVSANVNGINAGTYASIASGTDENYNLTFVDGTLTIIPRAITITADSKSKVYGSSEVQLSTSVSSTNGLGLASTDSLSDVTGTLSREAGENVGSYSVSIGNGLKARNYLISYESNNSAYAITPDMSKLVVLKPPVIPIVTVNNNSPIVSEPVIQQIATKVVTLSEVKTNQENNRTQNQQEVRVPISNSSVVELVNGGVNLPLGVDQLFFVANNEK